MHPIMLLTLSLGLATATMDRRVLREARAVADVARLEVSAIAEHDGPTTWVTAKITPSPTSGIATIPGAYVTRGKLHVPEGAHMVVRHHGTFDALQTLAGDEVGESWSYEWPPAPP